MASTFTSSVSMQSTSLATTRVSFQKLALVSNHGKNLSFNLRRSTPARLSVSCAAKPETVAKVSEIVKRQLGLDDSKEVVGESKFENLGADSLDTVEIVMGLEEAFDIEMEEDKAQGIKTVDDAAALIEELMLKK